VNEGLKVMRRLRDPQHRHNANCRCASCSVDRRTRGCSNPHACAKAVESRLNQLRPK
jgi:hypothetical protein